jgi:hypothetical protein
LGLEPDVIDVIRQDWIRSDRKRADRFSIGELDFAALGLELAQAGYVDGAADWSALTEAEVGDAIRAVEGTLRRRKLTFSPLPRRKHRRRAEAAGREALPAAAPDGVDDGVAPITRRERRLLNQRRIKAEQQG